MAEAVEALRTGSAIAFAGLGLIAMRAWRRTGGEALAWAAATFGLLATIAVVGRLLPEEPNTLPLLWVTKLVIAGIVAFPYLLFRFAAAFRAPGAALGRAAVGLTAAAVIGAFALPDVPGPTDPRPWWFLAYSYLILVQWTVLFASVAIRLWRSGEGQPTLARRRMRLLAAAAAGLNLLIVLAVIPGGDPEGPIALASQILGLAAATGFALGLDPPRTLRELWRREEESAMRRVVADLIAADEPEEVLTAILPHAAALTAASGAVYSAPDGRVIATYGHPNGRHEPSVRMPLGTGQLVVTPSPYTPVFGDDEIELLRHLARLADLAIARTRVREREREFLANAAHELRTPMTVLTGLSSTLAESRVRMSEAEMTAAFAAMERQGERARRLVTNLLDLARLDHEEDTIPLEPVDAAAAIRAAVAQIESASGVPIELTVEGSPMVLADAGRLERVIVNLLDNAVRHGASPIKVGLYPRGADVDVLVEDGGEGLSQDLVASAFDPFTQGAETAGEGSGLGLALVRRIVRAFGGKIEYERGSPGARFTLTLRRAA